MSGYRWVYWSWFGDGVETIYSEFAVCDWMVRAWKKIAAKSCPVKLRISKIQKLPINESNPLTILVESGLGRYHSPGTTQQFILRIF
jgi:hypothetical protein